DGVNSAASKPSSEATSACNASTVGSSPKTSSPTSASAIACRMPADGLVTVSLRRSTTSTISVLPAGRRRPIQLPVAPVGDQPLGHPEGQLQRLLDVQPWIAGGL